MKDHLHEELAELRLGLLSAELEKRWALQRVRDTLDVDGVIVAFSRCNMIQNAILYKEAEILWKERKDELLPPRQADRNNREEPPLC